MSGLKYYSFSSIPLGDWALITVILLHLLRSWLQTSAVSKCYTQIRETSAQFLIYQLVTLWPQTRKEPIPNLGEVGRKKMMMVMISTLYGVVSITWDADHKCTEHCDCGAVKQFWTNLRNFCKITKLIFLI